MQVTLKMTVPARTRKKGKWFISSCDLLDVHSQGRTRDEAHRNLRDALASFLISCYERGTLDEVLRGAGFVAVRGQRSRYASMPRGSKPLTVPLPFRVAGAARASA